MVPALTAWPAPVFIPSRWPTLTRPLRELPAPFLCAIAYSLVVSLGALGLEARRAPPWRAGEDAGSPSALAADGRGGGVPPGARMAPIRSSDSCCRCPVLRRLRLR